MSVYFAQSLSGGTVKIGTSENVPARIKALETRYGQPLAVLAILPGGREEEAAIHERFAEHRLGRSEQFRPVAEIMAFIGRPLLANPNPDAYAAMDGAGNTNVVVNLTGSADYVKWLDQFHKDTKIAKATIVRWALAELAKAQGRPEPPEI